MKCNFCGKYFCVNHIRYEDHKCPNASKGNKEVVLCKYCNQPIQLIQGVDVSILVNEHLRYNCFPEKKVVKRCPVPGCKEKLYAVNTIKCDKCGQEVCLKHRFSEDHDCHPVKAQKFSLFQKYFKLGRRASSSM
ncbi:uncharacterized protein [Blastocystis hominis]|uniref:AN1-type domain-containing protein n=1 Tax=Blastocystis hominis TaxID=12968 RepID=D8MAB3_BLAHO|nr:uncharacterized protein [Blastocystis hominis]CBK25002.2 unnamed protein product [Blastocystis hominis]|eukprot:XP_012899050.1 uncharacterized protein [Blastocystis hominis]